MSSSCSTTVVPCSVVAPRRKRDCALSSHALPLQARGEELNLLIADLAARLEVLRVQVRQGAALPGDTAVLRAEILKAEQNRSEVAADYRAAVALVAEL